MNNLIVVIKIFQKLVWLLLFIFFCIYGKILPVSDRSEDKNEIFITDYRKYSFLLNNQFIPNNLEEKEKFEKELEKYQIKREELFAVSRKDKYKNCRKDKGFIDICQKIRKTFDRCITENSNILQGCVWRIGLDEIDTIEILKKDGNMYGSLNYARSNGERMNWIDSYYKKLK